MEITQLATSGLKLIYGATLGGFGLSAGRDIFKNFGKIVQWVVILAIGVGSFVLPFMAGKKITQWHPMTKGRYFFRVLLVWLILGAVGFTLLWGVSFLIVGIAIKTKDMTLDQFHAMVNTMTAVVGIGLVLVGMLAGSQERKKRRAVYEIAMENQQFLDEHGIREIDGQSITHVDGDGNRLKLEHVGKDIIEFKVQGKRGNRALISIDASGRYLNYSGAIAG